MKSIMEYQESARKMGAVIAEAARKRGEIAVADQEAVRRAERQAAADKWAADPTVDITALDLEGDARPDGPIATDAGKRELDALLERTRNDALAVIRAELKIADGLASSAPQDLTNLVLSMQLRKSAGHDELADLYERCAPVSWPLAKSVMDAARGSGLLIWAEQAALDAEAPRALVRKADELLAMIEGRAGKRPTTPGYGATSRAHGDGSYAELELLDAVDGACVEYAGVEAELADHRGLTSVYDAETGQVTEVRSKGGDLDRKALRRLQKAHADAMGESAPADFAGYDERLENAFRVR